VISKEGVDTILGVAWSFPWLKPNVKLMTLIIMIPMKVDTARKMGRRISFALVLPFFTSSSL